MEEDKYKAALERAKSAIKECGDNVGRIKLIESIFPELGESRDEKIRKKLIEYFKGLMGGWFPYSNEEIIAWLEKQGRTSDQIHYWTEEEIEPIINDYLRGAEHYGGMIGRLRCLKPKSLEKQGEKPANISVDKMVGEFEDYKVISCGRIPSFAEVDAYRKGVVDTLSKILIKEEKPITIGKRSVVSGKLKELIDNKDPKSIEETKKKMLEEAELSHKEVTKKSEQVGWSEEDESICKDLISYFNYNPLKYSEDLVCNWLKSIKERLQ